jgi:hypothetical protein
MQTDDNGEFGRDERGKFTKNNQIGNRFGKGETGNPQGKNAFGVKVSAVLKRRLSEAMPDAPEKTIAEGVADALIRQALDGDISSIRELLDRSEGKALQKIDASVDVFDWQRTVELYDIPQTEMIDEIKQLLGEFYSDSSGGGE